MSEMNKKNDKTVAPENGKKKNVISAFFSTVARWAGRMFFGASKELGEMDIFEVEKLESPSRLAVKSFFRRKLAVGALIVLIALFLFVFIGPLFIPMNVNYTDPLQANIAPNYSMLSVPSGLKNNVRDINGFSNFTVGVSNDNTLYMWGYTKNALSKTDISKFPDEIREGGVYMAAAGYDHVIAITVDGKIVGWGNATRGQYGYAYTGENIINMPETLKGNLDVSKISDLTCGYQCTALVYDGQLYLWGNRNALLNMQNLIDETAAYCEENSTAVKKIVLGNYYGVVLYENGAVSSGSLFNRNTTSLVTQM